MIVRSPSSAVAALSAAVALAQVIATAAGAATFQYNSCFGTSVEYKNISESSADAPLYNQPQCVGDLLDFDPTGFEANSSTANPDFIDGNLLFTIAALTNFTIDKLLLDENGDWLVFGEEPSNSQVSVTLTVRLEILIAASGGGNLEVQYTRQTPLQFTQSTFNPVAIWSIHEEFPMAAILADACSGSGFFAGNAIPDACGATTVEVGVNIDNSMLAFAKAGEAAFINKKDFDGFTITAQTDPVPEPAPGALLVLGLAGLAVARRWTH